MTDQPFLFAVYTKKKDKLYTVELTTRPGGSGPQNTHFEAYVSEFSNPDTEGNWQRVKVIANCGHSRNPENLYNAKYIARCFAKELEL